MLFRISVWFWFGWMCFVFGTSELKAQQQAVVKFADSVSKKDIESELKRTTDIQSFSPVYPVKNHPFSKTYYVDLKESKSIEAIDFQNDIIYKELLPKTYLALDTTLNDPYFPYQWALDFINAPEAWLSLENNSEGPLIAILDAGFDFDHEDLQNFIEFDDPINGIDDDGNGFIDDYRGWNFGDDDNNPSHAISSHGTQMAGLAIATNQNNTGLASACYNVPFFVSKITKSNGDEVDPYIAVIYAVDRGAKLINCSWYQTSASNHGRDAIDYAEQRGVLLVAAAGNLNADVPVFPASDLRVLSVGAVNQNSEKSAASNYGSWVDVFAPGVQVRTTAPNNSYILSGGTSSACAITSSALGFLMKVFPDYTPDQLIKLVKQTGRPLNQGILKNQVALDLKQAVNQDVEFELIDVYQNLEDSKTLHLHIHSGFQADLELKVYNSIGQLIDYQKIKNPTEAQQLKLPTAIKTGIYLIELSGGAQRKSKKIHIFS